MGKFETPRRQTRLSAKSPLHLANRRATRLSPKGLQPKPKIDKVLPKFEPTLREVYLVMQQRAAEKLKFKRSKSNTQMYVIHEVKRTFSDDINPNDFDFSVIAEQRGTFFEFHWKEMVKFYFLRAPAPFVVHEVERLDKDHHRCPTAQLRSEYFAEKCVKALNLHQRLFQKQGYIFTLDGRLRNTDALYRVGIDLQKVIVIEMNPIVALFQKLLAMLPSRNCNVIYTGDWSNHPKDGFQRYMLENLFQNCDLFPSHTDACVIDNLVAVYADFCGDIPTNMNQTLQSLPNLQVFGVTRAMRNTFNPLPVVSGFHQIRKFRPDSVGCWFYARSANAETAKQFWASDDMDEEFVMKRILDHSDDMITGEELFYVEWVDGSITWEGAENLHNDDILEYRQNLSRFQ